MSLFDVSLDPPTPASFSVLCEEDEDDRLAFLIDVGSMIVSEKKQKTSSKTEEPKAAPPAPTCSGTSATGSKVEERQDLLATTFLPHLLPAGHIETDECTICSKVGEHCTARCPYKYQFPKGVRVGSGWDVVCWTCGTKFSGNCCGMDYGRAIPKRCFHCSSTGEHWSTECPRKDPDREMYPPSLFKCPDRKSQEKQR